MRKLSFVITFERSEQGRVASGVHRNKAAKYIQEKGVDRQSVSR